MNHDDQDNLQREYGVASDAALRSATIVIASIVTAGLLIAVAVIYIVL